METIKTIAIAGYARLSKVWLVASVILLSLIVSQSALAWKVKTHVWLSKQVVDEIRLNAEARGDGSSFVSIHRPQIDPNNIVINSSAELLEDHQYGYTDQIGEKIGDYEVAPEIVSMLSDDQAMLSYFAGVMGPDNYPDLATGQTRVHPHTHVATDEWFKYLYSLLDELDTLNFTGITDFNDAEDIAREIMVNSASREADERAVRAFIYGYITHGIGDLFMHTFVNNYAGGEFTIGVNMFKHSLIEGYVAKKTPELDEQIVALDIPESVLNFIYHYLGDVKPDTELERLMPWVSPLEPLVANVDPDTEWNGLYEVSYPRIFSTFRNQLQDLKDNPSVLANVYQTAHTAALSTAQDCGDRPLIPGVLPCGLLYLEADAIQAASATASLQHTILQPFLEEWIDRIEIGLEEWVELHHELGRFIHLVESEEINKDDDKRYISDLIDTYTNLYFLPMLGVPQQVGLTQQKINEIHDFFWPEWLKNKIFDFRSDLKNNLFLAATSVLPRSGQAGTVVTAILPEEKMNFDLFMDYHLSPGNYFDEIVRDRTLDHLYRKDDHQENSRSLSLLELGQKLGLDRAFIEADGTARTDYLNPNWFRPAWNVRQLNKMLFLSKAELTRLISDLNCEGSCSSVPGQIADDNNPGNNSQLGDGSVIPENIMLGFLGTLDRDNQWKAFSEKYADPFRDFSDDDFTTNPRVDNQGHYTFASQLENGVLVEPTIDDFRPRKEFGIDLTARQMVFADCFAYLQVFKVQEGERYSDCLPPLKVDAPVIQISASSTLDVIDDLSEFAQTYSEPVEVTFTHDDPDALIFYTISELNTPVQPVNNSDPNEPVESRSHPYTGPFTMQAPFNSGPRPLVVRAQAYKSVNELSFPSDVQQASITIDAQLPEVSFFPPTPNHTGFVNVTLSAASGSTIFYTLNGTTPDFNSTRYTGGNLTLNLGTHTIRAIAYRLGYNASEISTAQYNVYDASAIRVADPVFTPASNGNYVGSVLLNIETHTQDAELRYEITYFDDTNNPPILLPDENSDLFTQPVLLDQPGFYAIRVIGFKNGLPPSNLASLGLTVVEPLGFTEDPIISPRQRVFNNPVLVDISSDTNPATGTGIRIFYTIDGSDPIVLPNQQGNYNSAFELDATTTVKAQATRSFFSTSGITEQTFSFVASPVVIDTPSGSYENSVQVSLTSDTIDAEIYYTTNGAAPNESSTLYQGPFELTESTTLIAKAFKQGYESSTAVDASYEIFSPSAPLITRQPQSVVTRENDYANFLVTATGLPDVQYQWLHNGSIISDATDPVLELFNITSTQAGSYQVEVSNSAGLVYSNEVELTVLDAATPPVFISQPENTIIEIGESLELNVQVEGNPTPEIKWFRNGIEMEAQFGSSLSFPSVDVFHTGEYYAEASNIAGEVQGDTFQLIIKEATAVTDPDPNPTPDPETESSSGGGLINPFELILLGFVFIYIRKIFLNGNKRAS